MYLNTFSPKQINNTKLESVEITLKEIEAIKFMDVNKLNTKKCSKEMKLSIEEFNELITNAREKIGLALIEGKIIKIIEEKIIENEISTLCKFRCAVCGEIYTINYTENEISCPLCFSSKIMTNEEAGFLK